MALSDVTKEAIELTIAEYDELTRDGFHAKYGFGDPQKYWLIHNQKRYPSKAIVAVAHQHFDRSVLAKTSGGDATMVKRLKQLGFVVESPGRNPDWDRDEAILALDLYLENPTSPPRKTSREVRELSALLNKMHRLNGTVARSTLRNTNGVYLKMMNFRSLDPTFVSQGKTGMPSTSDIDEAVWKEYEGCRKALSEDAAAIRAAIIAADEGKLSRLPHAEPYEGEEGGVIVRLHKRYERDPKLVMLKKEAATESGSLRCELCTFDFEKAFGALGAGYMEVHHINALHQLKRRGKTKLEDLALLCANCHRMAHRRRVPLSLQELKAALQHPQNRG